METERAPAKINLYLHVIGRRDDGYHLLDSLVVFADVADVLHATGGDGLCLTVSGPFGAALGPSGPGAGADNLVVRAACALAKAAGLAPRAHLVLEKHLPVAAGIGGGSADAAAALRALQRLWRCELPGPALRNLALTLGADVPVCLRGAPARMSGIGERLDAAPALPPCSVVLVNPGVPMPTPSVFRARTGPFSAPALLPARWRTAAELAGTLRMLTNDLEPPARALEPVIGDVLEAIAAQPGCLLARMSGSGATCFGLFADRSAAFRAEAALQARGWWCASGAVLQEPPETPLA